MATLEASEAGNYAVQPGHSEVPPRVLVLGDSGVGGMALVRALRSFADGEGVDLAISRGQQRGAPRHLYADVRLSLIVWEAALECSLSDYSARYSEQLHACVGRQVPAIVVCNKTDTMPCPLPQVTSATRAGSSSHRGAGPVPPPRPLSACCLGVDAAPSLTSADRWAGRLVPLHRSQC
jgi:hypothetical protein